MLQPFTGACTVFSFCHFFPRVKKSKNKTKQNKQTKQIVQSKAKAVRLVSRQVFSLFRAAALRGSRFLASWVAFLSFNANFFFKT